MITESFRPSNPQANTPNPPASLNDLIAQFSHLLPGGNAPQASPSYFGRQGMDDVFSRARAMQQSGQPDKMIGRFRPLTLNDDVFSKWLRRRMMGGVNGMG